MQRLFLKVQKIFYVIRRDNYDAYTAYDMGVVPK